MMGHWLQLTTSKVMVYSQTPSQNQGKTDI